MIKWVPRELGRPCRLHRDCRLEHRLTNSRLIRSPVLSCWGRTRDATLVSPSEGNEARRDGRQGVGVPHSSAEAGERPSGPCGAKGVPRCGRGVGTTPRTLSLTSVCLRNDPVVCGTAIPQCDEPDASSTGTSGSVEQKTHLVTPPRPTSEVPIIGFSTLLQLVDWCHVRRQRSQQGGSPCVDSEPSLSPPALDRSSASPGSSPVLADADRRIPRANPGHPQPDRGPTARPASGNPGGNP
jgi:hypothetical protein